MGSFKGAVELYSCCICVKVTMAEETNSSNKNLPESCSLHTFPEAGNRDATVQQKQPSRPSSAANKGSHQDTESTQYNLVNHKHTLHWFACVGGDEEICPNNSNCNDDEEIQKEREERIKMTKERQNEERQRKLEELKAQALAAQKFREQKEEERRRRMEDLRRRENDRRSQVEERRRAIIEADNERREYILRKNMEREHRLETKKRNERSQIQFAFGSSTPRMIDDTSMSSSFWAHRRATSITNVAYTGGVQLTRRSSERELGDNTKKRATSASGLDRSTEDSRRMSSSMYEVFNWSNTVCPNKKLTLSIAGSINIDDPPTRQEPVYNGGKDDSTELYQRGVNRRKTDLMPTIPSPRDSSRASLGTHTPRTPGRAFSMTRLDQLATPRRRNGEHISAIVERERKLALDLENLSRISFTQSPTASDKRMSRSMSQLAGTKARHGSQGRHKSSANSTGDTSPLRKSDTSKSMSQLHTITRPRMNRSEKLRQQIKDHLSRSIHSSSTTATMSTSIGTGLRSGEITPNSLNTSRPGSAMSSSTTASGVVYRRSLPLHRKPRPASIAVTGVSAAAKEEKPPLPKSTLSPHPNVNKRPQSASTTPSRAADAIKKQEKRASSARATPKTSTPLQSPGPEKANRTLQDSLINKPMRASLSKESSAMSDRSVKSNKSNKSTDEKPVIVASTPKEKSTDEKMEKMEKMDVDENVTIIETDVKIVEQMDQDQQEIPDIVDDDVQMIIINENNNHEEKKDEMKMDQDDSMINKSGLAVADISEAVDMTASMIAKARITTEEEAKAALAERRRLAREEAERQAELERKRIEAEEEAERQKQLEEEERLRKLEEESIRLAEEQRRAEEERLQQAIEEARKREEEEKARREEEARLKIEREENEKKAREEAEKQRLEMVEKLKKEEKEREERRKRVEAIMSRTRAKGSATNTPTKNNTDEEKNNAMNSSMTQSQILLTQSTTSMNDSIIVDQKSIVNSQQSDVEPASTPVKSASGDYEKSVTEKENLLLGSFNVKNMNNSNNTISSDSSNHQPTTNGKSTTELIIDDAIISSQSNGHKNGSIDNNMFSDELPVEPAQLCVESAKTDNNTAPSKLVSHHHNQDLGSTGQLIDFSSFSSSTNDDPLNFNNNNNTNLTNSNNNHNNQINNNLLLNNLRLVTSDSQENNGDLSLL